MTVTKNWILYIGIIIGLATYLFWDEFPKGYGVFYKGNAIFILSLCLYLFFCDTKSFIKYVLFCLSLNNLADELFFDPKTLGYSEMLLAITVLIFAVIRNKNAKRP